MFTDKAKELFNNFIVSSLEGEIIHEEPYFKLNGFVFPLEKLPLSMQIGVIEDFAEILGYLIDKINYGNRVDVKIYKQDMSIIQVLRVKNTEEARQEMIKQLNDLINEKEN